MIEIIVILSMFSGWLLFKFYKILVDYIVDKLALGLMAGLFTFNLARLLL